MNLAKCCSMITNRMNTGMSLSLVEPRDFTAAMGRLVKSLRLRAGLTQPELASRTDVPASTISRMERTGLASTDRLARILFALDGLDDFKSFLDGRIRLAELPDDLSSFQSGRRRPKRVRHRKGERSGT